QRDAQLERVRHAHLVAVAQQHVGHVGARLEKRDLVELVKSRGLREQALAALVGRAVGLARLARSTKRLDLAWKKYRALGEIGVPPEFAGFEQRAKPARRALPHGVKRPPGGARYCRGGGGHRLQFAEPRCPEERRVAAEELVAAQAAQRHLE